MIENNLNGSVGDGSNIEGISPCLVRYVQNVPSCIDIPKQRWKGAFWSKKQSSIYFQIKSGLRKAEIDNLRVRSMALSSPCLLEIMNYQDYDGYAIELQITKDLQVLRKRIYRDFGFIIDYIRLRTYEGEGVMHILFTGGFIPYEWLRKNWFEIHGAWNVDIQDVSGKKEDVARYFVHQYLVNQPGFVRTSKSDGWIFKGCVREWNYIKSVFLSSSKYGMSYCLSLWDKWLMYSVKPDVRHIVKKILRQRKALECKRSSFSDDRFWYLGNDIDYWHNLEKLRT